MDINNIYNGQVKTIPEAVISFITEFIGEHTPVIFEYTVTTIARDYESKHVTTLKLIMKDNKDFMKQDSFTIDYSNKIDPIIMEGIIKYTVEYFKVDVLKL